MDNLRECINRKRRLLALPDVPETSDAFLSDLRHLYMCVAFCDQHRTSGDEARFTNLELLDQDEALGAQRAFEAKHGIKGGSLGDVLDHELKKVIEFTFTSGSLYIAEQRKRKTQADSIIVCVSEGLNDFSVSHGVLDMGLVETGVNAVRDFCTQNGIPMKINQVGSTRTPTPISTCSISEQITRQINSTITDRKMENVLAAIAIKPELKLTQKGCRPCKELEDENVLWMDPQFCEIDESFPYRGGPYGNFLQELLLTTNDVETNGKDREEVVKKILDNKAFTVESGECIITIPDKMTCFGEQEKKKPATLDEIRVAGERFEPSVKPKTQRYGKLSEKWLELEKFIFTASKTEVDTFLSVGTERLESIGVCVGALHRATTTRIIRPMIQGGKCWGMMFKTKSKMGDTRKEGYCHAIIFGKGEDKSGQNRMTMMGKTVYWHLRVVKSKGDWMAQQLCANKSRIWQHDPELVTDGVTVLMTPFSQKIATISRWRAMRLDSMFHVSSAWHHSPACEAASAMLRKFVEIVHAINQKRDWGVVGSMEDMVKEVEEIGEHLQTACDFRVHNMCKALIQKIAVSTQ
uniref:Acid polymerase n=2 Tax=Isavirus salaris TaxID=55987 RepID=B1N0X0_9ORTO|nr:PA protein [Isavirus salaris]AFQ33788.1 acid polymerase [Infectious salmon anemia virus]